MLVFSDVASRSKFSAQCTRSFKAKRINSDKISAQFLSNISSILEQFKIFKAALILSEYAIFLLEMVEYRFCFGTEMYRCAQTLEILDFSDEESSEIVFHLNESFEFSFSDLIHL